MIQPRNMTRSQALRLAGSAALAAAVSLAARSLSSGLGASGIGALKVGVRADIAGVDQLNEANGKYYGLEVDIAAEMASRMGYAGCEYSTVTPDSRKENLLDGNMGCLVACCSASGKRRENFDFSPTYYEDQIVVAVEKSLLITKVDGLKGGVFGTLTGANTAAYLANNLYERGFIDGKVVSANAVNTDVAFDTWHLYEFESYSRLSDAFRSVLDDDTRYLCKCGVAAHIIDANSSLATKEKLQELADVLQIAAVYVLDGNGDMIASSTPVKSYSLSTDPNESSYEFRELLGGKDELVQSVSTNGSTGEAQQFIRMATRDERGYASGIAQIAVRPTRLTNLPKSVKIGHALDSVKVGSEGFAFAVSKDDNTIACFPSDNIQGEQTKAAEDLGNEVARAAPSAQQGRSALRVPLLIFEQELPTHLNRRQYLRP